MILFALLAGVLAYGMGAALYRDTLAAVRAPKGQKADAYLQSRRKGIFWP